MHLHRLKEPLEGLYRSYHRDHLSSDPISVVHTFDRPEDQEVVAMIAAVFAYGQVRQILKTVRAILKPMGNSPYEFLLSFDLKRDARHFKGMVHRFNTETDILLLMQGLSRQLRSFGSLRALFLEGYSSADPDIKKALSRFVDRFRRDDDSSLSGLTGLRRKSGYGFLFPSPQKGSACKRLNMYLRWMVRRDDGVDLGLWKEVSPAKLILPLDTHLFRISARIGLTRRKRADWATATEITQKLRQLDPADPVKYDFALARLGILKTCTKDRDPENCEVCGLHSICAAAVGCS